MNYREEGYTFDTLKFDNIPIISEHDVPISFRREYDFEWELNQVPTLNNVVGAGKSIAKFTGEINKVISAIKDKSSNKILGLIQDAMASGKRVAAYAVFNANFQTFAELVSSRAEVVNPPDDEIIIERYKVANVEYPVPESKSMKDITVTYVEDQYNNVYNFHKIWQECLRPGSDLCFMDIPSFSVRAVYSTTSNKLSPNELSSMYRDTAGNRSAVPKTKRYSQTVYPRIFPAVISRGSANATSKNFSRITVTYVRSPVITKNKSLTEIGYATGQALPLGWKSTK